ncbi:single-pass membrane and coiled-coil domain-containing protein 3-like isoform X2 [Protopterus annectens]|nr:single-pass membrane and coiled-coil domain-containing protein 3-like isoform X2 [Protopterus annectens]
MKGETVLWCSLLGIPAVLLVLLLHPRTRKKILTAIFGDDDEKERLIRASQIVYNSLHTCVTVTNKATRIVNEHLNENFREIVLDESKGIKDNCEKVIIAIAKIHEITSGIDKHIRKNINQQSYEKLSLEGISLKEKSMIAKDFSEVTMGIYGSPCSSIIAVLFSKADLTSAVATITSIWEVSPIMSLRVSDLQRSSKEIVMFLFGNNSNTNVSKAVNHMQTVAELLKTISVTYETVVLQAQVYVTLITGDPRKNY